MEIGDFKDKNVALIFCTRFVAKNFLLTGTPTGLIADKIVRVSVKSLALNCLSTIFELYPQVFLNYLDKNQKLQPLSDILFYANHTDPQLRGTIRVLVGSFIKAVCINNSGDYNGWIETNAIVNDIGMFKMEQLIQIFIQVMIKKKSDFFLTHFYCRDLKMNRQIVRDRRCKG